MLVRQTSFKKRTDKTYVDITTEVANWLTNIQADNGILLVFSKHTTACVKILENELLSLCDIETKLDAWAPNDGLYQHDRIGLRDVPPEERVNGHSHIRSLLFSSGETMPVANGKLSLGTWQTLFLVELDPVREREVHLTFIGEKRKANDEG